MQTNESVIKDTAPISTSVITHGLLNAYQAEQFLKQTFESTPLLGEIRHVMRREKTGEIDKIGIDRRILRAKVENTDDGYRAKPNFNVINYATKAVRVPWEITEESLRENIEGQGFESVVADLMTKQIGVDEEDLLLNGDEATASSAEDYDFLKLDNGFIKQIKAGGHTMDASSYTAMDLDLFYKAISLVPNKYNDGNLRWIMSPTRAQQWTLFLLQAIIGKGGAVPESLYNSPVNIPIIQCSNMPNDTIILTNPKNLIEVNTYGVQIRKTTEGKEAIMQDKRFYVVHFDIDALIEEVDATGIITGLPAYSFPSGE